MTEPQPTAYTAFEAELHEVERTLAATADELGGPLGELVRGQVMRARPSVRAALVLAVAMTDQPPTATTENVPSAASTSASNVASSVSSTTSSSTTPISTAPAASQSTPTTAASPTLRQARMNLAAALEMLYIALNIHRLLVDAVGSSTAADPSTSTDDEPLDRAFVGSTILAGDYCFSRAAQMAAHTDHPTVVALFAQTLQTISESRLRYQFGDGEPSGAEATGAPQHDTVELLESGAQAAAVLADMDAAQRSQAVQLAHELASQLVPGVIPPARPAPTQSLDVGLQTRRQILMRWLAAQAANGRQPTTP